MNTLYVSDMDGTLYRGGQPSLTPKGEELFRKLLTQGAALTLASGRNLYGIYEMARHCKVSLPVIAYNGAMIYDFTKGQALKIFAIEKESTSQLIDAFEELNLPYKACCYIKSEERCLEFSQNGYTTTINLEPQHHPFNGLIYDEHVVAKSKEEMLQGDCLFVGAHGRPEPMQELYNRIKDIEGVNPILHQSPYDPDNWFVDVGSDQANKGTSAVYLKNLLGAKEVVAFGDNHNDLPMLRDADRSYVVPEASLEVQQAATAVLPQEEDCVLRFIQREIQNR